VKTRSNGRPRHAAFSPTLPTVLAEDVREGLTEYLSTTYALSDPAAREALTTYLSDPTNGIFRGPYLRMRPPFRGAPQGWCNPLGWLPDGFTPYAHQARAFERLSTYREHIPQPTLVTTGTGSGKTESFLLPLLDHARRTRARGTQGITALVLYPMNALVTDQARRMAHLISSDAALHGLRVGVYIGGNGKQRSMGAEHVVDHRETLRAQPPQILLTNYKMLDLLLMNPTHAPLLAGADTSLTYLVLDEFHTYDGAQGTDVAMLLRRLGARLGVARPGRPLGDVVPVATSATLGASGTDPDSTQPIRKLAQTVFGRPFPHESVITEDRLSAKEAFPEETDRAFPPITPDSLTAIPFPDSSRPATFKTLAEVVLALDGNDDGPETEGYDDPHVIGTLLSHHSLTRSLLEVAGNSPVHIDEVLRSISSGFVPWYFTDPIRRRVSVSALSKLLALYSYARVGGSNGHRPLLDLQVQMWVRDVGHLLREVSTAPSFVWEEDADDDRIHLPAVYCRSCGASGWATVNQVGSDVIDAKARSIWRAGLEQSAQMRFLMRAKSFDGTSGGTLSPELCWLDPNGPQIHSGFVTDEAVKERSVLIHRPLSGKDAANQTCPTCRTRDSVRFIGASATTLLSVALSQVFGSTHLPEKEKKTLVFTDSVQDAAHRAAFIESRAFRFNLRSALIRSLRVLDGVSDLETLSRVVGNGGMVEDKPSSSRRHERNQGLYLVAPPDLVRRRDWEGDWLAYDTGGARHKALAQRLGQEAHLEVGLYSRTGRTLELTGTWSVDIDLPLNRIALTMRDGHQQLAPQLEGTQSPLIDYERWILGILDHLRLAGGISHPWLARYRKEGGNAWWITGGASTSPMRRFYRNGSLPGFLTTSYATGDSDMLTMSGAENTWLGDWTRRCLHLASGTAGTLQRRLLADLAELLVEYGVLDCESAPEGRTYGLIPSKVILNLEQTGNLPALRCSECGYHLPAPAGRLNQWADACCPRLRCNGTMVVEKHSSETNYYRNMYHSGRLRPIVAREHTGLLERDERENLERSFIKQEIGSAPNVLTCTPTLELGVDIGDLSVVSLASLPRTPASYLQRVGRAGRSDGNALVLAVLRPNARTAAFIKDPLSLIGGSVRPPAAYLHAGELLARQLVAFTLDNTLGTTLPRPPSFFTDIVKQWKAAHSHRIIIGAPASEPCWIEVLADYVRDHAETIIEDFLSLFPPEVSTSEQTRQHLLDYCHLRLRSQLENAVEHRIHEEKQLEDRLERARDILNNLEGRGHLDEAEIQDLERCRGEYKGLSARLEHLRSRQESNETFMSLAREGILPGYNLLDDTTLLDAHLWWRQDVPSTTTANGGGEISGMDYQVSRPAQTALTELAPGAYFYARGRRLRVDSLDTHGAGEDAPQKVGICPACGWAGALETDRCLVCGGTRIRDVSQSVEMMPLRKVGAFARVDDATITEAMDERNQTPFTIAWAIEPGQSEKAWRLTQRTFGAEYLPQAVIRTYNLGRLGRSGDRIEVSGVDYVAPGFITCSSCGVVDESAEIDSDSDQSGHGALFLNGWAKPAARSCHRRTKPQSHAGVRHRGYCSTRKGHKPSWQRLYLRHELRTQAIRLLLPETCATSVSEQIAIKAAVLLGVREDLGGDPQHLEVATVPVRGRAGESRFHLVLYDTVPGGTGYLDQYATTDGLFKVLALAWRVLESCSCEATAKDGCHRCVHSVLPSGDIPDSSRKASLAAVVDLLDAYHDENSIETIDRLDDIAVEMRSESVLEANFRSYLTDWVSSVHGTTVSSLGTGGFMNLRISVPSYRDGEILTWDVKAQRRTKDTTPDYTFDLRSGSGDGARIDLYLDGHEFHSTSGERNRTADDARYRTRLRENGSLVWSLSWQDVEDASTVLRNPARAIDETWMDTALRQALTTGIDDPRRKLLWGNPVDLLMGILRDPFALLWADGAATISRALLVGQGGNRHGVNPPLAVTRHRLRNVTGVLLSGGTTDNSSQPQVGAAFRQGLSGLPMVLMADAGSPDPEASLSAVIRLDDREEAVVSDGHKERWQDWLRWSNVLQMLVVVPGASAQAGRAFIMDTTTADLLSSIPIPLAEKPEAVDETPSADAAPAGFDREETSSNTSQQEQQEKWNEAFELIDPEVEPLLDQLHQRGAPCPLVGEEIDDGRALWPVELWWQELNVAVVPGSQAEIETERDQALRSAGVTVFHADSTDVETVLAVLFPCGGLNRLGQPSDPVVEGDH